MCHGTAQNEEYLETSWLETRNSNTYIVFLFFGEKSRKKEALKTSVFNTVNSSYLEKL